MSADDHERLAELAALGALGLLTDEERQSLARLQASGDPSVLAEIASAEAAAGALALAPDPAAPPPGARQRILERVRARGGTAEPTRKSPLAGDTMAGSTAGVRAAREDTHENRQRHGPMKLFTCNKCGAQFDVSSMQAGSTFTCGRCNASLTVPASSGPVMQPIQPLQPKPNRGHSEPPSTVAMSADQMKQALERARGGETSVPKLPKAMQQRAQAASSARAGAGAAPPAAKPAKAAGPARGAKPAARSAAPPAAAASTGGGRPARGRSSAPARPEREEKSKTPMFVGIGVGVAALALVGFMLSRGGSGTGETSTDPGAGGTDVAGVPAVGAGDPGATPTSSGGAAVPVVEAPKDEYERFLQKSEAEQSIFVLDRLAAAKDNVSMLQAANEFFSNEKLKRNTVAVQAAKDAASEALRLDDSLVWAHEARGERNALQLVETCQKDCPKAFEFPDADEILINSKLEELRRGPWVAVAEYGPLEELVTRIREREQQLQGDKHLVIVEKARDWIRKNPVFGDIKDRILHKYIEPYVVFQEAKKEEAAGLEHMDKERARTARLLLERDSAVFAECHRQYREMFGARYNLGSLREAGRVLRVLILWDRTTFNKWHEKQGQDMGGGVRAYYSPTEKFIAHYVGTEGFTGQDEWPVAGGYVQKEADMVTMHEATHQLQHEYRALYGGRPLRDEETAVLDRKTMWFTEGMSEYVAASEFEKTKQETLEGAVWRTGRIHLMRTHQARGSAGARQLAKKWTIAELAVPNHNGELNQRGAQLGGDPNWMGNLFYGRSWGFYSFCMHYDGGKYKENLLKYMDAYMKNEHSPQKLAQCFGRPDYKDFGDIEKEFEFYWDKCLTRVGGEIRKGGVATGRWRTPDTSPPTELYAEDDGGGFKLDEPDEDE